MEDAYKNDFEKFLSHTDEKQVLLKEISKDIEKFGVKSLLDIGAGNGLLAIPLSKLVKEYVAVEAKNSFVEKLKDAGIRTIEASFPTEIDDLYDMVLISHVISYREPLSNRQIIEESWKLVKKSGVLLIVTYRGERDDWAELMEALGQEETNRNKSVYESIISFLNSLGDVTVRKVTTTVKTDSLEDMIEALAFVASNGNADRKSEFIKKASKANGIFESKYKTDNGYFFPFQHFFLETVKQNRL